MDFKVGDRIYWTGDENKPLTKKSEIATIVGFDSIGDLYIQQDKVIGRLLVYKRTWRLLPESVNKRLIMSYMGVE